MGELNDIKIIKSEKSVVAQSPLTRLSLDQGKILEASLSFSLDETKVLNFELLLKNKLPNEYQYLKRVIYSLNLFSKKVSDDSNYQNTDFYEMNLVGEYDLSSRSLKFKLSDNQNIYKMKSSLILLNNLDNKKFLFNETKLTFNNSYVELSFLNINLSDYSFEAEVKKTETVDFPDISFLDESIISGVLFSSDKDLFKLNLKPKNGVNADANLNLVKLENTLPVKKNSFLFKLDVHSLHDFDLEQLKPLSKLISNSKKKSVHLSGFNLKVRVDIQNEGFEIKSLKGNIDNINYYENDNLLIKLSNLTLTNNSKASQIKIKSAKKMRSKEINFRDIKIDFKKLEDFEKETEISVSFGSDINEIIKLRKSAKFNSWFSNFLDHHEKRKEISITYMKKTSLKNIKSFFDFEDALFEINVDDLKIPITVESELNFETLKLSGMGNTILFEGLNSDKKREISGSLLNLLSIIRDGNVDEDLVIFLDKFNSEIFFPKFSTFTVQGPLRITLSPPTKKNNFNLKGKIDFFEANLFIPSLILKKTRETYGQLTFEFQDRNISSFDYKQKDVIVVGKAKHKSMFEIEKVDYSTIKTPEIDIKTATFKRFGGYNQFKTSEGSVSIEYLMRLKIKKREIPLDVIFNDLTLRFKNRIFLDSVKGEIRSYEGLRGYAKSNKLAKSQIELTISPHNKRSINMVIVGDDAGEVLRRGSYYKNGYGGNFKASILYENKKKISGSLKIENFRIKNAPVLAQIISSASIIGLLDNLNGNGLLFTKIEGSFDYVDRKLALKEGVAVGPSLGLTMSGYEKYGLKGNTVNVNGLVSPVYIINGVVKTIPLIGKVLGGDKGEGVFGVSYTVKGNSSNPTVLVNPLSILTPGVFRKIFNVQNN